MCSCATVMASGFMLFRWRRLDEEAKGALWSLYGIFTGFMCFGNGVSVVTGVVYTVMFPNTYYNFKYSDVALVAFRNTSSANRVESRFNVDEIMSFLASGLILQAAWQVLCSIDFACRCATNMLVLDRLRDFSVPRQRAVSIARWAVLTIVIAGCVAGVCASIISAVKKTRAASVATQAATAASEAIMIIPRGLPPNNRTAANKKAIDLWRQSYVIVEDAGKSDSLQQFSEMAVLLLLVVLFLVLGLICARRVRSFLLRPSLLSASAMSGAKHLHRQIVFTAAVVFITFLPRAVFSSMRAVSGVLQDVGFGGQADCPIFCSDVVVKGDRYTTGCKQPFNQYTHMSFYLMFAPEFHMIVLLISSSLAQVVALWGMTSQRLLRAIENSDVSAHKLEKLVVIASNTSGGDPAKRPKAAWPTSS
jgi:hypothetical protein